MTWQDATTYPKISLHNVLSRAGTWIEPKPDQAYKLLTVRMWGKGVVERGIVNGSEMSAKRMLVVRPQQFIVSRIDARHGASGIIPPDCNGAIVTNDFPVYDTDPSKLLTQYLGWLSKTGDFIELCKSASEGTTNRVRLKDDAFLNLAIPLPPLEEQRRIVARIEELAGAIAEARGLRGRSIEECGLLSKSSAKAIINNNSARQPLKDIVSIKGGGTPSKQNSMFWQGSIPWISAKDIKKREIYSSIDRISEDALNNSSAKMIEAGAVVVVTRGMILAHTFPATLLRIPATINQDLKALIPGKKITSEYLYHVLWALNDSILKLVEKSTHDTRKLETPKLLNFEIPVPPLPEQHRIVAYLDDLQAKVDALKRLQAETAAELDALLPSILDKAFKGEL